MKLLTFLNAVIFLGFISFVSYKRYYLHTEFVYDLENFNQGVWSIVHYGVPYGTSRGSLNNLRFGGHIDLILYFVAIFYYFFQSPLFLFLFQHIFTALAGIVIYLLFLSAGKNHINSVLLQILFYFNELTINYSLNGFHPEVLAASFLIFSYLFFIKEKLVLFYLTSFLALLCKENVALIFILYGFYLFLSYKKKEKKLALVGISLSFLSFSYFIISMEVIRKFAVGQNPFFKKGFSEDTFSWLGSSYVEVLKNIIKHPYLLINKRLFTKTAFYFINILGPFFFIPFLHPVILISAPIFFINIISMRRDMLTNLFHFHTLIVPVIFLSFLNLFKAKNYIFRKKLAKKKTKIIKWILVFLIMINLPCSFRIFSHYFTSKGITGSEIKSIRKIVGKEARILTQPQLARYFSSRRYIFFIEPEDGHYDYLIMERELFDKGKYKDNIVHGGDYLIVLKQK